MTGTIQAEAHSTRWASGALQAGWFLGGAGLWSVAHLAIHGPRGWPFAVLGEWELLLPAAALAAGEEVPVGVGALHGTELGTYLVALLASVPIRMGLSPLVAGKFLAMFVGAATAGLLSWWAGRWVSAPRTQVGLGIDVPLSAEPLQAAPHRVRPGLAAVIVAGLFALAWPGWHFELAGLSGRSPEALPLQILAAVLLLGPARPSRFALAAAGTLLGLAWLLSPASLWWLAVLGVVVGLGAVRRLPILLVAFVGGAALPFLFAPGGLHALAAFVSEQLGGELVRIALGWGESSGPSPERPGLLGLLRALPRALEGGAHNDDLQLRRGVLAVQAVALAAASGGLLVRDCIRRSLSVEGKVALLAASWLVPLSLLPLDRAFYPLAYRYWGLPLALSLVLYGFLAAQGGRSGLLLAALAFGAIALILPSVPRTMVAPPPSTTDALIAAGAHGTAPRPGQDRHAVFRAFWRHTPSEALAAYAQGYGLALGADAWSTGMDGRVPQSPWRGLAGELPAPAFRSLLVGAGCGMGADSQIPPALAAVVVDQPPLIRGALLEGLGACHPQGGPSPSHLLPLLSPAEVEGLESSASAAPFGPGGRLVRDLASHLPPRFAP